MPYGASLLGRAVATGHSTKNLKIALWGRLRPTVPSFVARLCENKNLC